MSRSFRLLGLLGVLVIVGGCADSLAVINLADRPVYCRVYHEHGNGPDIASDVAPGGQLRTTVPGAESLAGCVVSVSERSAAESSATARTTAMTLERRGSRRLAIRSTADGLIIGPDLGQKR